MDEKHKSWYYGRAIGIDLFHDLVESIMVIFGVFWYNEQIIRTF